eukprot:CAMPEP_0171615292 /NCGR_PEP_ID=MMETSP0990-20121206/12811_1 /TAXON_ID=483369 /ORGANISM="non described non described, Strain CCMP2098" /LENGTH=170 /DNA_ID=CAMNT_0012179371 /DNA_START=124 /DNA_END=636 /DNA_ORIENTATION=-
MHMEGFKTTLDHDAGCILLIFPLWVLDTKVKFCSALMGSAALGAGSEFFTCVRREGIAGAKRRLTLAWVSGGVAAGAGGGDNLPRSEAAAALLYAAHVLLGYILMLIAMTYQVELLAYVVAGILLGHLSFNTGVATGVSAPDACCVGGGDSGNLIGGGTKPAEYGGVAIG